jgi:aerobic carbon-monoxide dehydrogenase medium subunit
MSLPRFEFHDAASYDEAFDLWSRYDDEARYISGGTALVLLMRAQLLQPAALISIGRLPGMRGVARENDVVRIGAATTHAELAGSPLLREELPTLADTFSHVATPRVRNVATVGGNLAHANPHQDPPVTLMALDASVIARGPMGERRIALDDFFLGYFESSLEPGEVLTAIEVPVPRQGLRSAFIKYLPRSAEDYATINVAVTLRRDGDRVADPRIVIGSMGPTPVRAVEAERLLAGHEPDEKRLSLAGAAAAEATDPVLDSRGTPEYKRRIAPVVVARAIRAAWAASPRPAATD